MRKRVGSTSAEATLDALADPVLVREAGGAIAYVNAAATRLLGEPADAIVGRPADSIFPERLRALHEGGVLEWVVKQRDEAGRPVRAPIRRHDGVEIHQTLHVSTTTIEGEGVAIVLVLRPPGDPTEIESDPTIIPEGPPRERSYQAVFEAVPVGAIHFDARGRITDCNAPFVAQMGSTRELVTGLDMLTLPNEGVTLAVGEALAGRDGRYEGPYRSVTGDRASVYRALFSPIVRDGRVVGGVGIVEDITERRSIEARLAQGDRMASLGRLAAGVAHEINNPLAYVRTSLDIARREVRRARRPEDGDAFDTLVEAIDRADEGVERVRVIASDLKTFSRGDEAAWAPVDLAGVAESAINLVHNELRHRAELIREYADVPPVMGSETRFVQVLVNLLANAAQALPEDGRRHRIVVRIGRVTRRRVFVEVEDDGEGIDPAMVAHIFEPFWTSKPPGEGTGLGLSICHGIVTAAGGEIRVARTAPGQGTTFRIELPVARSEPPRARGASAQRPPRPTPTRRHRILVVDDEALLGVSLRVALSEIYDVTVSRSGKDALARLRRGQRFDLILCDVMMPGTSGIDLYAVVLEELPAEAARFVFMTGGAFTERARAFLAEHPVPLLHKPFGLEAVDALLSEREPS